jgi:hypothetical protein
VRVIEIQHRMRIADSRYHDASELSVERELGAAHSAVSSSITRRTAMRRRRPALQVWACREENPDPVRLVGDITLMEAWTSINPDRRFARQTVEICQETRTSRLERDGRLSVTCHPMNIAWLGGSIANLINVERIKIVSRGVILIETSLNPNPGSIIEIADGVTFDLASVP